MADKKDNSRGGTLHLRMPEIAPPQPEIRYDSKLVREMTDAELDEYVPRAQREFVEKQNIMRVAVEQYATYMAIANILMFEKERRTKSIRLPGELS